MIQIKSIPGKTSGSFFGMGRKAYSTRNLIPAKAKPLEASPVLGDRPAPDVSIPLLPLVKATVLPALPTAPKELTGVPSWAKKTELARLLGISPRKITDLVKGRVIPYRKYPSGMIRFNLVAVETALSTYDVGVRS